MLRSSCRPTRTYARRALIVALATAAFLAVPAYAVNYVPNPGFETCVQDFPPTSWAPAGGAQAKCDGTQANTGVFSVALSNSSSTFARAESDCIVIPPSTSIPTFQFAYRTSGADVVQVALSAQSYTGTDCTGSNGTVSAGAGFNFLTPISTNGEWHTLPNVTALIEPTTHSVRFAVSFQVNTAAASSLVRFDDLEFADASGSTTSTTLIPGSGSTSTTTPGTGSSTTTTLPPTFPGTGSTTSECYVTFEGIASGRIDCTDGDPACDADGAANGSCSFPLRVCVATPLTGCQVATVTSVKAKPRKLAIPLPAVPTSTPACGAPTSVVVPLRRNGRRPGRVSVKVVVKSDGKPKKERDVLRFRCLPPG
jgi:hypothetical protein